MSDQEHIISGAQAIEEVMNTLDMLIKQMGELGMQGKPSLRTQNYLRKAWDMTRNAKTVYVVDVVQGQGKLTKEMRARAEAHDLS